MMTSLLPVIAQQDYKIVDSTGKEVSWDQIAQASEQKPYVFFGEIHGKAIAHKSELALLQNLHQHYPNRLVLAMEMFEADVQPIIDEYFEGQINQKSFESEARVWKNYSEDYKPTVEYARDNNIKLVASNVPRRYANTVYHNGIDTLVGLSSYAKQFLPPLPISVDTTISIYREMKDMVDSEHQGLNLIHSQALKDATMAHFLLKWKTADNIILHLNGAYHSKNRQGIPSFLSAVPSDQILTINTVEKSDDMDITLADYTLILE